MSAKEIEPTSWPDRILRYGIIGLLITLPFHAFLTVWLASIFGHYEIMRLWKEFVLVGLGLLALGLFFSDREMRKAMADGWVFRLGVIFIFVVVLSAVFAAGMHTVSPKAIGYGLIVDIRPVLMMLVAMVAVRRGNSIAWARLIVAPAIVVAAFAVLQFTVLPANFLTHFGYGSDTIPAYQTIDSTTQGESSNYIRVQSTLRGPNPLGAYLIPVLTVLVLGAVHFRTKGQYAPAIILVIAALLMTFSRSAVLGAVVSAGVLLGWTVQRRTARRLFWFLSALTVILIMIGFFALRSTSLGQNVFFHTNDRTKVEDTPNEQRAGALKDAVKDIVSTPLGGGTGSAGPASFYNQESPARLSENYFLQIGQETGILGLGIFIALIVRIIIRLWGRRQHGLSRAALAALLGLIVVNMVSHAWADDTLAYIFWPLLAAGISVKVTKDVLARPERIKNKNKKGTKTEKRATIPVRV